MRRDPHTTGIGWKLAIFAVLLILPSVVASLAGRMSAGLVGLLGATRLDPSTMVGAMLGALFFGAVRERSRSVLGSAVAHGVTNASLEIVVVPPREDGHPQATGAHAKREKNGAGKNEDA
jgi:membrane protease YdiL (CAAX protease family)